MLLLLRISSTTASLTRPELPSPVWYSLIASVLAMSWLTSAWWALWDVDNAANIYTTKIGDCD